MTVCAVGYSNILFGLLMLESFTGESHATYFGILRLRKIFFPPLLLILIQICIPGVSFLGHFFGIVAAVLVRYPLRCFLPRKKWIEDFEGDETSCVLKVGKVGEFFGETDEGAASGQMTIVGGTELSARRSADRA